MSSGATVTVWGEGASLALVGPSYNDAVTIKVSYGVNKCLCTPSIPIGLVKTESDFIVRSVETVLE